MNYYLYLFNKYIFINIIHALLKKKIEILNYHVIIQKV